MICCPGTGWSCFFCTSLPTSAPPIVRQSSRRRSRCRHRSGCRCRGRRDHQPPLRRPDDDCSVVAQAEICSIVPRRISISPGWAPGVAQAASPSEKTSASTAAPMPGLIISPSSSQWSMWTNVHRVIVPAAHCTSPDSAHADARSPLQTCRRSIRTSRCAVRPSRVHRDGSHRRM